MQCHVKQAYIHITPSLCPTRQQSRYATQRGYHAGHKVDHGETKAGGRSAGLTRYRQEATLGLHEVVIAWPISPVIVPSISRNMGANDIRFDRFQRVVIQPHFCGLTATEIVPDHITRSHKIMKQRATLVTLQVQRDALLRQIERLKIGTVITGKRCGTRLSRGITASRPILDLDHFRSQLGQIHRPIRARTKLLNGQYTNASEGF